MYVKGAFSGEFGSAIGEGDWCTSESPDHHFVCTLTRGHSGKHIAGTDLSSWVAEWDDDRSTDTHSDFFTGIGL